MKNKRKIYLAVSVGLLCAFVLWTVLVSRTDVEAIGPNGSSVGFSHINGWFHSLTGANMWLYTLTDWLGLVPIAVALAFAISGLVQWIRRKRFWAVDRSILVLGGFYIAVMAVYVLFEFVVINRRPVLIEGYLEASYPSSTTMLVACVMPTAMMQIDRLVKNKTVRFCANAVIFVFIAFMVIGRLISGVHWLTDIIGGMLISASLVMAYYAIAHCKDE